MPAETGAPKRATKRRATIVVSVATASAVGLIAALAVNGTFGNTPATAAPTAANVTQHATLTRALQAIAKTASSSASYYAYIAAETGSEVVEVNVAAGSIVGTVQLDLAEYGMREQSPLAVEHGSSALVTGGFETQDFHGGKFSGGLPGKSLRFAARVFRIASPILLPNPANRR